MPKVTFIIDGEKQTFRSRILPPYVRRSQEGHFICS